MGVLTGLCFWNLRRCPGTARNPGITENQLRPPFIFLGIAEYRDPALPGAQITPLGTPSIGVDTLSRGCRTAAFTGAVPVSRPGALSVAPSPRTAAGGAGPEPFAPPATRPADRDPAPAHPSHPPNGPPAHESPRSR